MAVTESDLSKSLSRIVTKFDTEDVDGTGSTVSGKSRKQKRIGNDGTTWARISINSFPQWLNDFIAGYKAGFRAVVAAEPIDLNNLGNGRFTSVVQVSNT